MPINKFDFWFVFMLGILFCTGLGASEKSTVPYKDMSIQHKQQLQKIARLLPDKARECLPTNLWITDELQKSSNVMIGNGAISGQVTEAAGGGGIAGVIVRAHLCECPSYSSYDTTDASGNYIIDNLPAGKYTVWTDNDSIYTNVYYNDKPVQNPDTVIVTSESTTENINFSLRVGGIITGLLTLTGSPYISAYVEAIDTLTNEYFYTQPFSIGDTATYTIKRLPTGQYRLKTYNMIGYIDEYYDNKPDAASATIISVIEGSTYSSNNITLDKGAIIKGTITSSSKGPLNHMQVFAYYVPNKFEWLNITSTNSSGVYRLTGLRSGDWKVFCYGDTTFAWEWYDNASSWNNATTINVSAPDSVTGRDFSLEVGGSISGYVYDAGANPIFDCQVIAFDTSFFWIGQGMRGTRTNSSGYYKIGGLRTGSYFVEASTECDYQFYDHESTIIEADLVSITMPNDILGINFNIPTFLRGDVNKDGIIDVGDIVYLINYLYKNGPVPVPLESGDTNCDGNVDVGDIVILINYLFKGGAAPSC